MSISLPNTIAVDTLADASKVQENFLELGSKALNRTGDTITGNITVSPGVTIDGVDVSSLVGAGSTTPTYDTVTITGTGASALDVAGGINAGSGNVGIIDTTGKIPAISTTYFASVSGANLTGLLEAAITDGSLLARLAADETIAGTYQFTPGLKERGRSTAIGAWTAVTFSAGNFTASGSMTWTVASGDQTTYAYTLIGKTMILVVGLGTTTVAGTPSTQLRVAIPGSFLAARTMRAVALVSDNGGGLTPAEVSVVASQAFVAVELVGGGNWTASVDNTAVRFNFTFEVQ